MTYKNIFLEEKIQYKMSSSKTFYPRRAEELTYMYWQYLRLFKM